MSLARLFHLSLLIVFCSITGAAQTTDSTNANTLSNDASDSLRVSTQNGKDSIISDSINIDSASADTLPPKRKSSLEYEVLYNSDDSMLIDLAGDKVYLYGNAVAEYGDIKLEADYIEISLSTSELMATGMPDSTGKMAGYPIFTQGDQSFDSEEMRYNFKTQRGLSRTVKTQEGDGYIHGKLVKKDTGNVIYIKSGKYTTCEYDDPHYHIHADKLKIITGDKIVTGPAYLSFADVPTPLAVPFGFFPNSEDRANGLIIPSWGEATGLGIGLVGGGYYFGVKDRADFALTADIYSRGSWNGYINSRYVKRYKRSGSLGVDLIKRIISEPEFADYENKPLRYRVRWTHRQDPKANPNSNFSASVDFGNPDADRLNLAASAERQLRNSTKSSVSYNRSFANTPFNLRLAGQSDQNAATGNVSVQLPSAALTMNRIFPFKSDEFTGKEMPWEKIGVSASLEGRNQVQAPFTSLFTDSTFNEMQNGMQLNIPINAGYKVFKYLTLTPEIRNRFVGTRQTIVREWNADSAEVDEMRIDQLNGFWEGSTSLSLSTIVYGIYQYKSDLIQAMRHQVTPRVGISYKPDYSDPSWGYFRTVQSDTNGRELEYSIFEGGVYGGPSANENGVLNFGLNNTFELKVADRSDSTDAEATKKLKVLDAFNFSTNYNLLKDSNNWSPLNIQVRTSIIPGLTFQGAATLNPYAWNETTQTQLADFWFDRTGQIGRWTAANARFSYSMNPKSAKKGIEEKRDRMSDVGLYYDDFVDFDVPWNARVTYNIRYTNRFGNETIDQTVDLSGEINITRNWRFGLSGSYDIRNQRVSRPSIDIYRDLHCWEMRFNAVLDGDFQRYTFAINVKAETLQDLKLNRNRQFRVNQL